MVVVNSGYTRLDTLNLAWVCLQASASLVQSTCHARDFDGCFGRGKPAELARRPRGAKGTRFSAKPSIIKQQGGSLFVPNSPPEQQLSGEGGLPASGLQRQGSDPIIGGEPSADAPERQSSRVRAAKSRWEPSALGQINEGLL